MRDLREDLQARLNDLEVRWNERSREVEKKIEALEDDLESDRKDMTAEREAVERLFAIEQRRFGQPNNGNLEHISQSQPLADFLVTSVRHGVADKENLKDAAVKASYFPKGESGGRQVHFTLLNLVRGNRLQEFEPGRYCIPAPPQNALDALGMFREEPAS